MTASVDLRELAIDRSGTGTPPVRRRQNVLTRYVLPSILVCGFLALVGWAGWDVVFPPRTVTVVPVFSTTAEVQQEGTPLFKAAGWIEPRPTPVRVAALAAGVVEKLLVLEDQAVASGEPVAELVPDDARLAYESAKATRQLRAAEVEEAQATLTAAVTRFKQPVHLQAALGEAEANLAKIETVLTNLPFESRRAAADYEAAQKDFEGKTASRGAVPEIQITYAKSKMESAQATLDELKNRHDSLSKERAALIQRRNALKTQLSLLADEIKARDEAEAKVKAAQARLALADVAVAEAKLQLDRMTVRAPMTGRIFRLVAHPGASVGGSVSLMTGQDASTVVTMYDPQRLQIRVDVRFEDIPHVSLNQPVEIDNPALETPLVGHVLFVSSEADIQKNTLQVKVAIPEPPSVFKPEMLVDVTFLSPAIPERHSQPTNELKLYALQPLVRQGDEGAYVWVADQSAGIARRVAVQTGTAGGNGLVEITGGLTIASRLISSGTEGLEDGDRIRISGEGDTAGLSAPSTGPGKRQTLNRLHNSENH